MQLQCNARLFLAILTLFGLAVYGHGSPRVLKIGAIFHKDDDDHRLAFLKAISDLRGEQLAPAFELIPVTKYVEADTDSFNTGAIMHFNSLLDYKACELLQEGVAAIFGPTSLYTRGIVASIAARFNIPHIEYVWRESDVSCKGIKNPSPMTINVFPDNDMINQAIADVVDTMGWHNFAVIYENDEGLSRIQKTLTLKRSKDSPITVRQIGEGPDYRPMLKAIRSLSICNIIMDVEPRNIINILQQAKEVKLLGDYCNFLITYLDSTKLNIREVRNGTNVNITGFSLRKEDSKSVNGIDWVIIQVSWFLTVDKLNMAVLYDAVFLLSEALNTLNARNNENGDYVPIDPVPLSCEDYQKYEAGSNITSIMREISKRGKITGAMSIDEYGRRRDLNVTILDFRNIDTAMKGFWINKGLYFTETEKDQSSYWYTNIREKTLKVTTRVGAPYVIEVADGSSRGIKIDQKFYEGYCIDLIDNIAKHLGFKYEFELVPDGAYGTYHAETKTWDGLIRRLLDREADLAICDLTINYERESAVDFTMPFMNLGISIVYNKPDEPKPQLFTFLSPFSADVWLYMATAYLGVSLMLFLQARMAPGEWDNPHPCNAEPEELENIFNLKNSMWLTIGSLMQQGCDLMPKAPSIRMLTTMWWFFTLIMISSYTANLAAFLTVNKMETPIKGVEDLAKQTKIKYGCLAAGSTRAFFQHSNYSTYKRMYAQMIEWKPSVFTENNDEGIERVIKGKRQYAFLMESTSIEYKTQRECEIEKIGGLLDNKGYGIALPRNSPYRTPINSAILTLQEKGTLQELKKKWWIEKGGGLCEKTGKEQSASTNELGLHAVGGVFLVLLCGCGISLIIAICEFLWNIRKVAVKEKITPWEAFIAELKFAVSIWEVTKPVKIAKSSSGVSSMNGGPGRAASTTCSIVGSFLRLDMLDKLDKDNTNNRSNDRPRRNSTIFGRSHNSVNEPCPSLRGFSSREITWNFPDTIVPQEQGGIFVSLLSEDVSVYPFYTNCTKSLV